MRTVREVVRLSLGEGRSIREISSACALPKSTVSDYLKRAREVGLTWPLAPDMSDSALETQLFGASPLPSPDLGVVTPQLERSSSRAQASPRDAHVVMD